MNFHMHLLPTYRPGEDPPFSTYLQNVIETVVLAEELGWEGFWFTEHHFLPYGGPVPNPAIMMAAAAARTSTIRLGCGISILPLHHPVQTAEDYAMVDAISGGRLEFGIGTGNTQLDYDIYGIDREERRDRFAESFTIIINAWTKERFSHEGKFWRLPEFSVFPQPAQKPHPPLWVAGTAPDSLRWAGENGFNVMTVSHPVTGERVRGSVAAWREGLRSAGHDPANFRHKTNLRVWVDTDGERARAEAERGIARYDALSNVGRTSRVGDELPDGRYDWAGMLAQARNIYGTPEDCIRLLRIAQAAYDFDICSTTFNFGGAPHTEVLRAMRLFAKEVMPALR